MASTKRSERRQAARADERRREAEIERALAEGRPPVFEAPAKGKIVEATEADGEKDERD